MGRGGGSWAKTIFSLMFLFSRRADIYAAMRARRNSDADSPTPLLLAGAHHRGGSEMLTRMMGALCKSEFKVRRWKSGSQTCVIDAETSRAQHGVNASAISSLHTRGVRLFSSGRWSIAPSELHAVLGAASSSWRFVHLVRPPLELIVSSYLYHLTTSEPWAHVRDPPWARRMGLTPPLPAGATFSSHLRTLNRTAGVLLQTQHSMRLIASMVSVAEDCASHHVRAHCTSLWLHSFLFDFDAAAIAMLSALGIHPSRHPALLLPLRRAGKLSDAQAKASQHVTRGKDDATREMLFDIVRTSSAYGPALRRLDARLRIVLSSSYSVSGKAAARVSSATRPRCIWHRNGHQHANERGVGPVSSLGGWWSSDEPTQTIHGATGGRRAEKDVGGWRSFGGNMSNATLTPLACCEHCRAAVDPACLFFNYRTGVEGRARCTLLLSRRSFHATKHALSGEA